MFFAHAQHFNLPQKRLGFIKFGVFKDYFYLFKRKFQLSEKQNTLQLCHCFVVIKAVPRCGNPAWRKQPDFIIVMERAHAYSRNFAYFIDRFHKPRPLSLQLQHIL